MRREPRTSGVTEVPEVDDKTAPIPAVEDATPEPDATEPDAAEPDATEPDAAEPGPTEPGATEPGAAEATASAASIPVAGTPEPAPAGAAAPEPSPGRPQPRMPGLVFAAVTVVPALVAAAWLLPGLPLLLTGRLTAPPMVFMSAPLAVGLCYFALRQLPASWPGLRLRARPKPPTGPQPEAQPARKDRAPVPWWAVAATVAVAVVFAIWQIAERTEQIIYLRDPATYLQVGYWIAHHGVLPIPDSLEAFGGPHAGLTSVSNNYYPVGSGLAPQFMTGMPLVLAAAIWLGGIPAALVTTPLIGACAVLSFGGLAGLAGPRWAPAAAAVLAVSLPEQYTSRSTFSEPLAQVLLFGGLCLLIDSMVIRRRTSETTHYPAQDMVLAALAGLTLGLTILVRIDGLSDILPVVPFLGVLLAARRRQGIPLGIGLVVGVGYGLADGYLLSRPYLDLEAPSLRPLALITGLIILITLAGVLLAQSRKGLTRLRGWLPKQTTRWLPEAAAIATALIFVGFAIRPLVQTVAGETDPTSIAYVAELQKLAGLPIDGKQQYYQDSLYWVIWYIGLPAVLLGAFGLAMLARRCARALLTWKDPDAEARIWALPLLIAIWVIVTVLWRPAVSPDQPWASRRLVPFVLPGLILGAIWATAWLRERAGLLGRNRATSAVVATFCAASLLIPPALTNLDLGFARNSSGSGSHLSAHGMAFRTIGAGELTAVNKLCTAIGPDASVVIVDSLTADRFAQLIRGLCDTPTAQLTVVSPANVSAVIDGIRRAGRRPVLLAQQPSELTPYGASPVEVLNLLTTQEAHNLTAPPTRTWLIHYTVWMLQPLTSGPPPAT